MTASRKLRPRFTRYGAGPAAAGASPVRAGCWGALRDKAQTTLKRGRPVFP
ncbi:hypothetical protein KIF59_20195 [Enterobacter cloacae subsp. cloacae]|nr:hypothetical protein [Enterobacter cloacae subsp. cloacae]